MDGRERLVTARSCGEWGAQDPRPRPSGGQVHGLRKVKKGPDCVCGGGPPREVSGAPPRRSQCALYSTWTGWFEKSASSSPPAALTVWSGLPGCRSRCCPRSRWPSSGGRRRRAWRPGASCGLPAVAGLRSPGTGPSPGGAGSGAASLVLAEGSSSPPGKGHREGVIGGGRGRAMCVCVCVWHEQRCI